MWIVLHQVPIENVARLFLSLDDPKQRRPDITKAQDLLDWNPTVDRSEGLKRTYAYFKGLSDEELNETEHFNFDKYILK